MIIYSCSAICELKLILLRGMVWSLKSASYSNDVCFMKLPIDYLILAILILPTTELEMEKIGLVWLSG